MWSKTGVQQFTRDAIHYTHKGLFAVSQAVELAGMLKGAYQVGGQLVRAGATILPLIL